MRIKNKIKNAVLKFITGTCVTFLLLCMASEGGVLVANGVLVAKIVCSAWIYLFMIANKERFERD